MELVVKRLASSLASSLKVHFTVAQEVDWTVVSLTNWTFKLLAFPFYHLGSTKSSLHTCATLLLICYIKPPISQEYKYSKIAKSNVCHM